MRFGRNRTVLGVAALAALLAFGSTVHAQTISKCQSGKKKCVSKKMACLMNCHAKAEAKGVVLDTSCTLKCKQKFDGNALVPPDPTKGCIQKLQLKSGNDCTTPDDTGAMEAKVDAFVLDVVSELDPVFPAPVLNKCASNKKKCVSKKAKCLLGCHAKFETKGVFDPNCLLKCKQKFDGNQLVPPDATKGCIQKVQAKGNCITLDETAAMEAKVDAFVDDVVCELDPTTPSVCPGGTPTPGGPTTTPTPGGSPGCGNGTIDPGEDCDPPGSACPNTAPGFNCSMTCTCACPTTVTFAGDSLDPVSKLDVGWTGIAFNSGIISDGLITSTVSGCAGSSRPCGTCNLGGPIENVGSTVFKSKRCTNNTSKICTSNTPCNQQCVGGANDGNPCTVASQCPGGSCVAAGTCQFFFGSTLPLSSGGVATCTENEISGSLTGTANIESGESHTTLNLRAHVFTGITTDQPCPQCNGDATANDGVAGGSCVGGDRNGLSCDANGTSPNVSFGTTSLACPPTAGANIANLPIALRSSTDQEVVTLSAANPNCAAVGFTTNKCFCDTCNNANGEPCGTNVDCPPSGGNPGVCGGRRCIGGTNNGAPCASNSVCPPLAVGFCQRAGQPTAPNSCLTVGSPPDCVDTVPVGDNRGECINGPLDSNCAAPEQHRGCTIPNQNTDCPVTMTCLSKNRECYLDNGVIGGQIIADGLEDTPVNDSSTPTLAALFCVAPTGASAVNTVAGLPGPSRLRLRGQANGHP